MSLQAPRAPLALILVSHPSVAQSEDSLAELVVHQLVPMLEALALHPQQKVGWHIGGHLLDHLARHHEGFLLRLRAYADLGQLEVLGGPFYGGVPALLSEADVRGQVAMAAEFWESFLGAPPIGCLLPEMAWAAELPRLLHDTGLAYGVLNKAQVTHGQQRCPSFGQLSRGGLQLYALCVDQALSRPLAPAAVPLWCTEVAAAAAEQATWQPGLPLAAMLPTAGLGPLPDRGAETGLGQLFARLAALGLVTALPKSCLASPLQAVPMVLQKEYAPLFCPAAEAAHGDPAAAGRDAPTMPSRATGPALSLQVGDFARAHVQSWAEFPARFAAVDTLYRRMLRASDRLQGAIERMEDENLGQDWSGQLATAQRAIFRAQSSEAFGAGHTAGFVDVRVRDAALRAICLAEESLDGLSQAAGAASPGTEQARLASGGWQAQGDLQASAAPLAGAEDVNDDLFVKTADQALWLEPRRGRLRSVEPRGQRHNLLDAWTSEGLTASSAVSPLAGGICDAVVLPAAGSAKSVAQPTAWRTLGVVGPSAPVPSPLPDDRAGASLVVTLGCAIGSPDAAPWQLTKHIVVPASGIGAQLDIAATGAGQPAAQYTLSVPLRLAPSQQYQLDIDDRATDQRAGEHAHVTCVRLLHGGRAHAQITLRERGEQAGQLSPWSLAWEPGATALADGEGGVVLTFRRSMGEGFASSLVWQGAQ